MHLIKLQFPVIITISLHQVNNQSYLLVMLSGSLGFAPTREQIGQVLWFCTLHWVHWQNTSLLPFLQVFFGPLVSLEGHRLGISFSAFPSNWSTECLNIHLHMYGLRWWCYDPIYWIEGRIHCYQGLAKQSVPMQTCFESVCCLWHAPRTAFFTCLFDWNAGLISKVRFLWFFAHH